MKNETNIEINTQNRSTGKAASRALRVQRTIPAIVYGPKITNINFCISQNDAVKYSSHKFDNEVFSLKSDDKSLDGIKVLMKDYSFSPKTHIPTHIDFYAPDMTKTVRVNIELSFNGKAKGMAEGGIFNAIKRDIEVECLPSDIPDQILVDITPIELNGSLHVSDINLPKGLKVLTSKNLTIATVAVVEEVSETPVTKEVSTDEENKKTDDKK